MRACHFFLFFFLSVFGLLSAQNPAFYVSDAGNYNLPPWQILKFDPDGSNPELFISEQLDWPQDILFLEDKNEVLISNLNSGKINRHNASTGAFMSVFASGISGPTRMKIGADNLLYVLQWSGNGRVLRYDLNGNKQTDFNTQGLSQSIGLDWDTEGNLYVSSYSQDNVVKYSPDGNLIGNFITTNLAGPTNIWFDENGDLIVSDYDGNAVKRFDSEGNYKGVFLAGVNKSEGFDFLPNGNILVGNGGTSEIKEYTADGTFMKNIVEAKTAGLLTPNAVRYREAGTSITETKTDNVWLSPSVGSSFSIVPHKRHHVDSIEVFQLNGQHVATFTNSYFTAEKLSSGAYFAKLKLKNGTERVLRFAVN